MDNDKIIRFLEKWFDMLSRDGKNTKMQVKNDIQFVIIKLKEGKEDEITRTY